MQTQKVDNSWYENGELPPVNKQVLHDGNIVLIVAHLFNGNDKYAAFQHIDGNGCGYSHAKSFRPTKSDREKAIEDMQGIMAKANAFSYIESAKKLYDAGYRKVEGK